jgi:hypothetical protein
MLVVDVTKPFWHKMSPMVLHQKVIQLQQVSVLAPMLRFSVSNLGCDRTDSLHNDTIALRGHRSYVAVYGCPNYG